jgi:hypothetical protein
MQIFLRRKVKKRQFCLNLAKKGEKHKRTDLPDRTDLSSLNNERKMIREIRSKMSEKCK